MRITKLALIILIIGLFVSILFAIIYKLITIEFPNEENRITNFKKELQLNDRFQHLFWFLQISDIHISIYHDLSRISDFQRFCSVTIPKFNTKLVIASGDLTDAKAKDNVGSRQFESEWKMYRNALDECQIPLNMIWLDIRGNHDNFNVLNKDSVQNYYRNYSIQGKKYDRSYLFTKEFNGDVYSFIGIDACIEPGPKRPFNFVGILTKNETDYIEELIAEAKRRKSDYIVWFGHYPTSCITTYADGGLREIFGKYTEGHVYLCGHYHKLGGLIPNMYTLQKSGYLELELADWKDNREFRLMAFDNGLFSFVDIKHDDWPVILITNPKDAAFLNLKREPIDLIRSSTHIRLLAFSLNKIIEVSIRINGQDDWIICKHIKGPLYVSKWNPNLYKTGLHYIEAYVKDINGLEKMVKQSFSLSNPNYHFGFWARFILMLDISVIFKIAFYTILIICVVPLMILRYMHLMCKVGNWSRPNFNNNSSLCRILFKFWLLSTVDRLFYSLIMYTIYVCVTPWAIGELVDNHIGIIFIWGIYLNGTFLPGAFTYAYGFLQLLTLQFPLIVLVAFQTTERYKTMYGPLNGSRNRIMFLDVSCIIFLMFHTISAYYFWLSYGVMAFIIGPFRTWAVIFSIIIYYQSRYLPVSSFRDIRSLLEVNRN